MATNSAVYHVFYVAETCRAASWCDYVLEKNSVSWLELQGGGSDSTRDVRLRG